MGAFWTGYDRGTAAQDAQTNTGLNQLGAAQGILAKINAAKQQQEQAAREQQFRSMIAAAPTDEAKRAIAMKFAGPGSILSATKPQAPPEIGKIVEFLDKMPLDHPYRSKVEAVANRLGYTAPEKTPTPFSGIGKLKGDLDAGRITPEEYKRGYEKAVSHAPAPSATITMAKPDSEYAKARLKGQATRMDDLEKAAETANSSIIALDRFAAASKAGTEGGAQPIITGLQNFFASFGFASDSLKDVAQMEQAVAEIKAKYMQQLGARGLTDQDMKILGESLPRVNTEQKARDNVVKILNKAHRNTIREWQDRRKQEEETYPELAKRMTTPLWYKDMKTREEVPTGIDPKDWAFMSPEDRSLWLK